MTAIRVAAVLCLLSGMADAQKVGAVLSSLPAPGTCVTGLAWDGKTLWAADHKTDHLYRLDPRTGKVLGQIPSPGYRPAGLAWDGQRLWNVDPGANKLYRIDVSRAAVDRTLSAPGRDARALAWDGKSLWVASRRQGRLFQVNSQDGTALESWATPSESVDGMAYDGRYLWVADRIGNKLHVVEPKSGEIVFSVPAPGPHVTGIVFDGQQLWVADYQTDRIYRLAHRGDGRPLRQPRRHEQVVYTHQVRNLGPGTLVEADVFLGLPTEDLSQKLDVPPVFSPPPHATLKDEWDQAAAQYHFAGLGPGAFATVTMEVRATLYDVQHQLYPHQVGPLSSIPAEIRRRYLQDGSKYLTTSPTIRQATQLAVGEERNPYWIARKIYRYAHQHLTYKLGPGMNAAPQVLEKGTGSCSEYAFVFIAMCRAAGVPARHVGSMVVREDDPAYDDVFHRWVEVYMPGYGWLPVDPARGDRPSEVERSAAFGHLEASYLLTSRGGGGSQYLGWKHTADERWVCKGRCEVAVETIAERTPIAPGTLRQAFELVK